jgi:hypothetical protein
MTRLAPPSPVPQVPRAPVNTLVGTARTGSSPATPERWHVKGPPRNKATRCDRRIRNARRSLS